MFYAASVCAVRLAACVWRQRGTSNRANEAIGVPRNFVRGGSTNSVEDRENGDLGAVAL